MLVLCAPSTHPRLGTLQALPLVFGMKWRSAACLRLFALGMSSAIQRVRCLSNEMLWQCLGDYCLRSFCDPRLFFGASQLSISIVERNDALDICQTNGKSELRQSESTLGSAHNRLPDPSLGTRARRREPFKSFPTPEVRSNFNYCHRRSAQLELSKAASANGRYQ